MKQEQLLAALVIYSRILIYVKAESPLCNY